MKKSIMLFVWLVILVSMSLSGVVIAEEDHNVSVVTLASVPVPVSGVCEEVKESVVTLANETLPIIEETPQAEIVPREDPEPIPVIPHTEEDVYLLAQLINSEAGIESAQCQAYVASVVINRLNSPEFPNTIDGVIFDRKFGVQFSVTIRNSKGHRPIDNTPSAEQIEIARYCLMNGSVLPSDVLVFYSIHCNSSWVCSRKKYTQVDHTIFSYIYK